MEFKTMSRKPKVKLYAVVIRPIILCGYKVQMMTWPNSQKVKIKFEKMYFKIKNMEENIMCIFFYGKKSLINIF